MMEFIPEMKEAALDCLKKASPKCRILLQARYFDQPSIKDNQVLADLLKEGGFNVNPKNIPQELANCLAPYRNCLQSKLKPE
jgi:hypothetical protein